MRKKLWRLIILSILTLSVPMSFVACNDSVDFFDIKNFYGEYSIPFDKYYDVTFYGSTDSGFNGCTFSIIGVKKNSFVHAVEKGIGVYVYEEMEFDEKLLAEVDRLIEFMGDHVELRKDALYFCDSRQVVDAPTKDFAFNGNGYSLMTDTLSCYIDYAEENIYSVKYKKRIQLLYVSLQSKNLKDMNDEDWQIAISRRYKKYY